jgi:predicted secreted protein
VPDVFATFCERISMKLIRTPSMALALMTALALPVASVQDQSAASSPHAAHVAQAPQNQVLHLSASAQTEVPQDWLMISLSVQKEGLQAFAVQKQLNAMVSAALAVATPMAKPGALEVKTGDMNVSPRYGRDGKMNGWVGSAQLVLQGRDVEQITTLAGLMPDLAVSQIDWRLSPEQKTAAEARIQAEAVAHFQSKAQSLTKQFGFAAYTLKEVRVSAQEAGQGQVMQRMAMAQMDAPTPMPVPAVAGRSRVVVNISGSIVLR